MSAKGHKRTFELCNRAASENQRRACGRTVTARQFLQRVAAMLNMRGRFSDDDVSSH